MKATNIYAVVMLCFMGLFNVNSNALAHQHEKKSNQSKTAACAENSLLCAKTVTSAFAPNGDLWRLWVYEEHIYYQISSDNGKTFLSPVKVNIPAEKISARNENRPKIGFDDNNGIYLSWASPREKRFTADVRFSYSLDSGKTFSTPITVNNDKLLAGHSFNEMTVNGEGEVNIVWLDGRFSHALRKQGKKSTGSALFFAQANPRKSQATFNNQLLANGTCQCCRIAMTTNQQNELSILWRHIYPNSMREFALLNVDKQKPKEAKPIRVSHDLWKLDGCPHQGGGISIDKNNQYHMVWFNMGSKGKGIFYANSSDKGQTLSTPISIGNIDAQAAHPHVSQLDNIIDITWTEFNGEQHTLMHQRSDNYGQSFSATKAIAYATNGADRPFIIKSQNKHYLSWQRSKEGHWVSAL